MTWERSLQEGVWVGTFQGDCSEGKPYDSGEIIMPARRMTFDSVGNILSEMELKVYLPDHDEHFPTSWNTSTDMLNADVMVRATFYEYDSTKSGEKKLRSARHYSSQMIPLITQYIPQLFQLVSAEHLDAEEYYFYNQRGDTERIEHSSYRGQEIERADTTWFHYSEEGNIVMKVIAFPEIANCCVCPDDVYEEYDTLSFHYNTISFEGRKTDLVRFDSLGYSQLYSYNSQGTLRKVIRLDRFGYYSGETEIVYLGIFGRIERVYGREGNLMEATYFNRGGHPVVSLIWRVVEEVSHGGYVIISSHRKGIPDNQPVLIREYHYEWYTPGRSPSTSDDSLSSRYIDNRYWHFQR